MVQTPAVQKGASVAARMRAEQNAREMRRRIIIVAVVVIAALALIAVGTSAVGQALFRRRDVEVR